MFLKRLTVSGFKSFADKVDFDFSEGISCIVGPNGCGKSNVVDAFKWVLGEQSARLLRGKQMGDMIFNGSSARRASSVSQVDLCFDNRDRSLSIDHDEVVVTRKLYRSGESEYALNHQTARLKDLRELFMDTGVGADTYSVIEQGRVDGLLQSSPQDRRVIFEEAAGISRVKARMKEAGRKLDRTEQNLLRVADVIEELEKRLRSVKIQATKARNFQTYQQRLNELRSTYALAEYHRLSQRLRGLKDELEARQARATQHRTDIARSEAEHSDVAVQVDELNNQITEHDAAVIRTRSEIDNQEHRVQAARQRLDEIAEQREQIARRRDAGAAQLEQCRHELSEKVESGSALERELALLAEQVSQLTQRDHELARAITQAQAMLEDEKSGVIDLLRESANAHNEVVRLKAQRESLVGEKDRIARRREELSSEFHGHLEERAQIDLRISALEELIAKETARIEEKRAQAARVGEMVRRLMEELADAKERRSALHSRKELLEDLTRRMEGIGQGVRRLLDRKAQAEDGDSLPQTLCGLVGDLFETDVADVAIVEAVLGEADQWLVVEDSHRFLAAIQEGELADSRIDVLCINLLPPIVNDRPYAEQPGVLGSVLDRVKFDQRHELLARHLFGKCVVVDDLELAQRLHRDDIHGHVFVTVKGEIVRPDGRITLGPTSTRAGLISRRSELRDVDDRLAQAERDVVRLSDQLNRTQAEAEHLSQMQQELRTAIYEAHTAKVEATSSRQNVQQSIDRLTREEPLLAEQVELLERQISDTLEKAAQHDRSLEALEARNKEREQRVTQHQDRIDQLVSQRQEVQDSLAAAREEAGEARERRAAMATSVETLKRQITALEESIAGGEHELAQCDERESTVQADVHRAQERIAGLTGEVGTLESQVTALRTQRDELRRKLEELSQSVKRTRDALETLEGQAHESQVAITETNVRRDELVQRIQEEMKIDLEQKYQEYEHVDQDWESVDAEIGELRQKMDRLGNVNLDAIQELEELEERYAFLTKQRDDLADSRAQLQQLITKLEREAAERFKQTIDDVREHFRVLFRKLFGGGKSDVVLENPDEPLESGIEILAQPPGKELQSISLLSGGEKSLTAIALVMSMFKCRPAPFAILDEVDAALDEANNERFCRLVQEFVPQTQFIIISHSKRTMSIGDHLYGITMQEPGVSTRVSVQLADVHVA